MKAHIFLATFEAVRRALHEPRAQSSKLKSDSRDIEAVHPEGMPC